MTKENCLCYIEKCNYKVLIPRRVISGGIAFQEILSNQPLSRGISKSWSFGLLVSFSIDVVKHRRVMIPDNS